MKSKKRGRALHVGAKGHVIISQAQYGMSDDAFVSMHPDQVDTVIRWLQEAKEEARTFVPEPESESIPK